MGKRYITIIVAILAISCILASCNSESTDTNGFISDAVSENKIIKATDFSVEDINGNAVKLSDKFGKPLIVNFWATWCGPCKSEMPHFNTLYRERGDEIEIMMINLTDGHRDTVEGVKTFIENNWYDFPVYFDKTYNATKAYGVSSIPLTLFINSEGEIVDSYLGAMSESTLDAFVKKIAE